jgi:hypothetical protein
MTVSPTVIGAVIGEVVIEGVVGHAEDFRNATCARPRGSAPSDSLGWQCKEIAGEHWRFSGGHQ